MAIDKSDTVKASSLQETIVAMLVMVLVFLSSIMIINNVIQSASLGAKTKAMLRMYELLAETKKNKNYIDESIVYEHFIIDKSVLSKSGNTNLLQIKISLENEMGDMIAEIKEQVIAE